MKTQCPYCNQKFYAPDDYMLKRAKCVKCGQSFVVKPIDIIPKPSNTKDKSEKSKHKILNIMELKLEERTRWERLVDFFSFRSMIFPQLLIVVFVLLFAGTIITTIVCIFEIKDRWSTIMWGWIMLFWFRIVMECLIIFFRMNATLTNIQKLLEKNNDKDRTERILNED